MSERLLRHGASSRLNHPNLTDISEATDRPPTVLSPAPSLLFPFLRRLSHPLLPVPLVLVRSHPTSTNQLSPSPGVSSPPLRPTACLPACGACFPIPHSTVVVVVARTLREKVTSRSRVSQDPANPSWYKIAPSGSHVVVAVALEGTRRRNERRREIGIPYGSVRFDTVDCGDARG